MSRATLLLTTLSLHLLIPAAASAWWTPTYKVNEGVFDKYELELLEPPKVELTSLTPTVAAPGDAVELRGSGFSALPAGTTVNFHPAPGQLFGASAAYTVLSDTRIRATVPAGARSGPIALLTPSRYSFFPYNSPIVLAQTPQSFQLGAPPAAPSQLVAWPVNATEVRLAWRDNSSNETAFEVDMRTGSGAWVTLGTVGANTTTEPITQLAPSTGYAFRLRALSAFGPSAHCAPVAVATVRAPALSVTNGYVSPFFAGNHTPAYNQVLLDANGNGRIDGALDQAPGHPDNIYPVFNILSGTGWQTVAGSELAPGANLVVFAEVATWATMPGRTQFVAVHMDLNAQTGIVTPIAMVAGDLDATVPGGDPVVMGSSFQNPPLLLEVAGQPPTPGQPGWIEGTVRGEVGFQSPGGLYYNALVILDFGASLDSF